MVLGSGVSDNLDLSVGGLSTPSLLPSSLGSQTSDVGDNLDLSVGGFSPPLPLAFFSWSSGPMGVCMALRSCDSEAHASGLVFSVRSASPPTCKTEASAQSGHRALPPLAGHTYRTISVFSKPI